MEIALGDLHGGIGWGPAALLLGVSFVSSFLTAAFGLGGGAIMLWAMATLLPPAVVIPAHGVVQLGSNAGRAAALARHVVLAVLPPFLAGAAVGVALGSALLIQLPPAAVKIAVGLFLLWSLFAKPPRALARGAGVAGAASSFLTMFFGATGPFVAAYVRTLGFERHAHVATHAALMTAQHLLKTAAFGVLGFAFGAWVPLLAGLVAAGLLGTLAGRRVLARIDERRFRTALSAILLIGGLNLIVSGLREVWGV